MKRLEPNYGGVLLEQWNLASISFSSSDYYFVSNSSHLGRIQQDFQVQRHQPFVQIKKADTILAWEFT